MDGFIVFDKPEGMTSHGVVGAVRRMLGRKKVGHTGTLDPFATGVLPVALGEATKAITFLDESEKEYQAVMRLGITTDTLDRTGAVVRERDWRHVTRADLEEASLLFRNEISQIPPMYSALKRDGVPLYRLARQGVEVERQARPATIYALEIKEFAPPLVSFTVRCSRGTYVRTLAGDWGERLGCGAHLTELRRTASGMFNLGHAVTLDGLAPLVDGGGWREMVISPCGSLSHLRELPLTEKGAERVRNGSSPNGEDFREGAPQGMAAGVKVRMTWGKRLVAVAESITSGWLEGEKNMRLLRVFN